LDVVITVVGGIAGLALGMVAGLRVGYLLRERSTAWYWIANVVAVAIGALGDVLGLVFGQWWLVVGSLAFIGGALTGLKYGYGRSVGAWRVHDEFMRSDDLPKG